MASSLYPFTVEVGEKSGDKMTEEDAWVSFFMCCARDVMHPVRLLKENKIVASREAIAVTVRRNIT